MIPSRLPARLGAAAARRRPRLGEGRAQADAGDGALRSAPPPQALEQLRRRGVPAPPNLPLRGDGTRDFRAGRPNELWVTDITEMTHPSGAKVYLSPVIDCFDGRPVAWSRGLRPTSELSDSSLESACGTLSPGEAPAVHSDRGVHYRTASWIARCESHGLRRSMSRKGMSCDNARAEGFFGLFRQEFCYPRDWSGTTVGEFMDDLGRWMERFRSGRISQRLGWLSPNEYRLSLGYPV